MSLAKYNIEQEDTTQQFALFTKVQQNGNTYRYMSFDDGVAQGYAVLINLDGTQSTITTSNAGRPTAVGIPLYTSAVGTYGWVQTEGLMSVRTAASVAVGAKLYTSATAGQLGADGGSDVLVEGLTPTATTVLGLSPCRACRELTVNT